MIAACPRPAHQEYADHVKRCPKAQFQWWCSTCDLLDFDADVEMRQAAKTGAREASK